MQALDRMCLGYPITRVPGAQALGQPGGAEAKPTELEALRALLPACAARGLPMLVANPDIVTVDASFLVAMPGQLAQVRRPWLRISHCSVVLLCSSAHEQEAVLLSVSSVLLYHAVTLA